MKRALNRAAEVVEQALLGAAGQGSQRFRPPTHAGHRRGSRGIFEACY
jgi:hypothetical protein